MDLKTEIGNLIAAARIAADRTQLQMADHLGLSTSTVSRIESGTFQLPTDRLVVVARWLNVEPTDLLPKRRSRRRSA